MVSISPAQRQRNGPVLQDFTKPGSRAACLPEAVSKSISVDRLVAGVVLTCLRSLYSVRRSPDAAMRLRIRSATHFA
jgi:hypothetical protein